MFALWSSHIVTEITNRDIKQIKETINWYNVLHYKITSINIGETEEKCCFLANEKTWYHVVAEKRIVAFLSYD